MKRLDPYPDQAYWTMVPDWYSIQTPFPAAINVATGEAFDPELVFLDPSAGAGTTFGNAGYPSGPPARRAFQGASRFGAGASGTQLAAAMPAPRSRVTAPHPAYGLQAVSAQGKTFLGVRADQWAAAGIGAALVWGLPRLLGPRGF